MSFETAQRVTEIMLALAFVQQSCEHLVRTPEVRVLFALRIAACLVLLSGFATAFSLIALCGVSLFMLRHFQGPYNGGADRMSVMILWCLTLTHLAPTLFWQDVAFSYLALQLTLSYFMSGKVKVMNPEWRNGQALTDVFAFSAYPVSHQLRHLANYPAMMWGASWAVMGFEVLFPLALFNLYSLIAALSIAALFHLANALLFGLNRFFWIWLAAYPALLWFQARVF